MDFEKIKITSEKTAVIGTSKCISTVLAQSENGACTWTPRPLWSEQPIGSFITCRGNVDGETFAEVSCAMNPRANCCYPSTNPLENITDFKNISYCPENEGGYPDQTIIGWFISAESSVYQFNQTCSDNGLTGDERSTAHMAFILSEFEFPFIVAIRPNETGLLEFCKTRGFKYIIIH